VLSNDFGSLEVAELINEFKLADTLSYIWTKIAILNQAIDEHKPWELVKTDYEKFEKHQLNLMQEIYKIAVWLRPFLPSTSEKIETALQTGKVEPLFQRIK
jgi:methionyl-tRNA synthetase